MKKVEQRKLLRSFTKQVTVRLLASSPHWPTEWDGHDIRELVAYAFDAERTSLMREKGSRKRVKAVRNAIAVSNLY